MGRKPKGISIIRPVESGRQASHTGTVTRFRPVLKTAFMFALAVAAATLPGASVGATPQGGGPATYGFRVVRSYPHDSRAFTQGLLYRDGFLFESTGLRGLSSLRKVRLETGEVVQKRDVEAKYFAEGLTDWGNRLIQLTWQSNVAFVYDLASFSPAASFSYVGEGWGLTRDATHLIMSDGQPSGQLRFIDPVSYREARRITVRDAGKPVNRLTELEFVRGEIFANVWQTDRICRIDPATGRVSGWIDLTGILPATERQGPDAVLNGIAYDSKGDRLFVTGKNWPKLFEITLERRLK
jgi:glutaminyl-peptide cyclotransferase